MEPKDLLLNYPGFNKAFNKWLDDNELEQYTVYPTDGYSHIPDNNEFQPDYVKNPYAIHCLMIEFIEDEYSATVNHVSYFTNMEGNIHDLEDAIKLIEEQG